MAVSCLGLSAFLTQLTLMRELLGVLAGNELVFGVVLGSWMLLTGIGSALGRAAGRLRSPIVVFVVVQVLIALLPIADVFLLRTLRNVVFLRGVEIGVTGAVASCLHSAGALLPGHRLRADRGLPSGGDAPGGANTSQIGGADILSAWRPTRPTECRPHRTRPHRARHRRPSARSICSTTSATSLGGLAFILVLVHFFDHFVILYFAAVANLLLAALVAAGAGKRRLAAAVGAVTGRDVRPSWPSAT